MSNEVVLKGPSDKLGDFWVETKVPMSEQEAASAAARVKTGVALPDKSTMPMPLDGLFSFKPHQQEGKEGVIVSPNKEEFDRLAARFCIKLSTLPPKCLPRSQRPMIKILQRMSPEPTGNPALDKGRQMIIDGTINKSLWAPLTQALVADLTAVSGK